MTSEKQQNVSGVDPPRRRERKDDDSEDWRENPVEMHFGEIDGLTSRDLFMKRKYLEQFQLHLEENVDLDNMSVREACEDDIELFISEVLDPDPDKSDSTGETILEYLSRFYEDLKENSAISDNPVEDPLEDYRSDDDRDLDSPNRPYIPFRRMKKYVNWLDKPFSRAFILTGLKHGTRTSEAINIDLRCLNINHPVFDQIIDDHEVTLDPRVRNNPDSIVIYESFNEGDEIPNEDTPGPEIKGEIRDQARGNKRSEEGGSILPVDSELKTAIIEWLLVRPTTYSKHIHPLFTLGAASTRRVTYGAVESRLWGGEYEDAIHQFGKENSLDNCPECGKPIEEENLKNAERTGRRYYCKHCQETHWRTITHKKGLSTQQKVTYHNFRHYFSDAHRVGKTEIHDGEIPEFIRKKRIRGDSVQDQDTDDRVYSDKQYQDWGEDVRKPYLNAIYKFGLYDEVIPAVGEGWKQ